MKNSMLNPYFLLVLVLSVSYVCIEATTGGGTTGTPSYWSHIHTDSGTDNETQTDAFSGIIDASTSEDTDSGIVGASDGENDECLTTFGESWNPTLDEVRQYENQDQRVDAVNNSLLLGQDSWVWEITVPFKVNRFLVDPPTTHDLSPFVQGDNFQAYITTCADHTRVRFVSYHHGVFNLLIEPLEDSNPVQSYTLLAGVNHMGSCGPKKSIWDLLFMGEKNVPLYKPAKGRYWDVMTVEGNDSVMTRFAQAMATSNFVSNWDEFIASIRRQANGRTSDMAIEIIGHGEAGQIEVAKDNRGNMVVFNGGNQPVNDFVDQFKGYFDIVYLFGCCTGHGLDSQGNNHLLQILADRLSVVGRVATKVYGWTRPLMLPTLGGNTITIATDAELKKAVGNPKYSVCECKVDYYTSVLTKYKFRYMDSNCDKAAFYSEREIPLEYRKNLSEELQKKNFGEQCNGLKGTPLRELGTFYKYDANDQCVKQEKPVGTPQIEECTYYPYGK